MMHYHKEQIVNMEKHLRTAFVNSLSGFKSLNLIGTKNTYGKTNLAIFNSVVHIRCETSFDGLYRASRFG